MSGAVTVKPLVWEGDEHGNFRAQSIRGGEGVDRWTEPSVIGDDRDTYEAWGIDGIFDTPKEAQGAIEAEISSEILSALTIQPADPMSDPRVVALVEAATKLRRSVCGPTGFADAVRHNSGQAYPWPSLDAAELALIAALRAIGGES